MYEMFARIDISDTGAGISESEQSKIFTHFYRSKIVPEQEGVGIGLYLARQIISDEGRLYQSYFCSQKRKHFFHIPA